MNGNESNRTSRPDLVLFSQPQPSGSLIFSLFVVFFRRMFEALATGCVPVVSSPLQMMKTDLPFPSLIDWDQVALHTEKLPLIQKMSDGLERLGKVGSNFRYVTRAYAESKLRSNLWCGATTNGATRGGSQALLVFHSLLQIMISI